MKRLVLVVLVLFTASRGISQVQKVSENPEVVANLRLMEEWTRSQMSYRGLPGISVGIVYDQELVYSGGFGFSNLEDSARCSGETIYRIASLTKTFTATAVLQLRDQGKLHLDDPVEQYLPWFRIKSRFADQPAITIRHLLTHTAGVPREAAYPYWTDFRFPTRTELIKGLENQELTFSPETKIKYSNLGYAILGEVVAEVAGMPYSEFVEKNIIEPLGMKSTTVYFQDSQSKRLAAGYTRALEKGRREAVPFINTKALVAALNISSTVDDLARFVTLQFRDRQIVFGDQILKGTTLREMHRVEMLRPDWESGWGLGFETWREAGRVLVGHTGWLGGYRSQVSLYPDGKLGVIVLGNSDDCDARFFANQIMLMMLPSIQRATARSVDISIPDLQWAAYIGRYHDAKKYEIQILVINGRLVMYGHTYPPEENPRTNLVELSPVGPHTFRMTGLNGDGELVVFEMEGNVVKRVKVGENYITLVK